MSYISIQYAVEIELQKPAKLVFTRLIDLAKWWPEDFKGEPIRENSEFVFTTGDGHHSTNRVVEFIPDRKVVWQTLSSLRKSDNFDWTGTKFIFELTPAGNSTFVKFKYDGVVQEHEHAKLKQICDMTLKEMFYNYIVDGKGKR